MIRFYLRLSAVAVALHAAGCADLRWHKQGVDAAALDRDLGECQLQARAQARHEIGAFAPDTPRVVGVDAQGRPLAGAANRLGTDRMLLEHDLLGICMRGKGYELVPVEKR
ncbi:MAG: hypothetical protein A3I02_01865 [Betaproteobacteria bacterium RIFCSPLOWO2_02_FULL_67_26]|nr:MAG: hypothetical protein A3I02_01865 [Betaproteobacteria bacterium RIFCSPLOWO2_02_FULL_67_26]